MKIKVVRRLRPTRLQRRYVVTCDPSPILTGPRAHKTHSDILPDAMALCPAWSIPIIDRALVHIRDARPWALADKIVTITIEIK